MAWDLVKHRTPLYYYYYYYYYYYWSRSSSGSIVTRLRSGRPGSDSWRGRGRDFVYLATASKPTPETTQPPIQTVTGSVFPGVMRPGLEADHSPPSDVEVKYAWGCISTPPHVFMAQGLINQGLGLHIVRLSWPHTPGTSPLDPVLHPTTQTSSFRT
jgi:hypothetical protein